jgi:hypothetical protein
MRPFGGALATKKIFCRSMERRVLWFDPCELFAHDRSSFA